MRLLPYCQLWLVTHAFNIYEDVFAKPKYGINYIDHVAISEAERDQILSQHASVDPTNDSGFFQKINDTGSEYLCFVPNIKSNESEHAQIEPLSMEIKAKLELEQKALNIVTDAFDVNPSDGIEILTCIYKTVGFWTYEFCYNRTIRQFHEIFDNGRLVEDPNLASFLLSKFKDPTFVDVVKDMDLGGEVYDLVERLEGGDKCDLTGEQRKVYVKYTCQYEPKKNVTAIPEIVSFSEYQTCQYYIVVNVPQLCSLEKFLRAVLDVTNYINCTRVGKSLQKGTANIDQYELVLLEAEVFFGLPRDSGPEVIFVAESGPHNVDEITDSFSQRVVQAIIDTLQKQKVFGGDSVEGLSSYEIMWRMFNYRGEFMCVYHFLRDGDLVKYQCAEEDLEGEAKNVRYLEKPQSSEELQLIQTEIEPISLVEEKSQDYQPDTDHFTFDFQAWYRDEL